MNGLNALGEVLQTPEPGSHCPTTEDPTVLVLPTSPTGAGACLPGSASMNIQIPDGKPYYINFSNDYYYRITRAGSLYEKLGGAHHADVDPGALLPRRHVRRREPVRHQLLQRLQGRDAEPALGRHPRRSVDLRRFRRHERLEPARVPADAGGRPHALRPGQPAHAGLHEAGRAARRRRRSTRRSSTSRSASRWRTSTRAGTARSTSRTTWPSRSRARRTTSPTRPGRRSSSTRTRRAA